MKTLFSFLLLIVGNTLLYFIFFWIVGDSAGKRLGLYGEILYSLYFTLMAVPLIYAGSFFINWAIMRENGDETFLITILLMWLANPISLIAATYLKGQKIDFDLRTIGAFALMLIAQLIMRLPKSS